MDVKVSDKAIHTESINDDVKRPSREEAMDAVKTLISWAGDNPDREGLLDTPKRVVKAYEEYFSGYKEDANEALTRTFDEVGGYEDIVFLRDINIESHCEHHMAPILGVAHVGYMPNKKVVGISKLARVIEIFAKRLQTQETMTAQIAQTIEETLKPHGVAIMIDAKHQCMTTRGIHKTDVSTVTTQFTGSFQKDQELRSRFMQLTKG